MSKNLVYNFQFVALVWEHALKMHGCASSLFPFFFARMQTKCWQTLLNLKNMGNTLKVADK